MILRLENSESSGREAGIFSCLTNCDTCHNNWPLNKKEKTTQEGSWRCVHVLQFCIWILFKIFVLFGALFFLSLSKHFPLLNALSVRMDINNSCKVNSVCWLDNINVSFSNNSVARVIHKTLLRFWSLPKIPPVRIIVGENTIFVEKINLGGCFVLTRNQFLGWEGLWQISVQGTPPSF